ncbi:thiol:disulfide interchange protein [Psychromonas sp. MB-3u-54]|uniref:thiol:disulfide interchange protein DsbA/DsbL n=1 Tax=Psychromonas sp. MB-3u-54 TaxID=2058319 RepID=UPI000C33B964|nr:thiol:disulfide interchange protein DsbA/DsbL [Psychromonas sp. MB-3u-54]PKH01953.1 thiol:disulfide interchange protein [Psychromonas sp. MB-3u-54]
MKKNFALIITLLLSFAAHAAQFTEGQQYQVLDTQPSSQPEVTEYFSFFCPHCNKFEPFIRQVKERLPENAKLQKTHVSFMGGSMGVPMAKAYATMVVLEVEEKMIPVMFRQIHDLNQTPRNEKELRQIFIDNGVEASKFDAAFNGFVVDSMQRRFDKDFKNAGLRGVPAVIVNNKYHLTPDKSINSQDKYMALVNFLLNK